MDMAGKRGRGRSNRACGHSPVMLVMLVLLMLIGFMTLIELMVLMV